MVCPLGTIGLHGALRRYGSNFLLGIRLQDEDHPAGTIDVLADGVMVGYLDMMVNSDIAKGLSLDVWFQLLGGARAIMAEAKRRVAGRAAAAEVS